MDVRATAPRQTSPISQETARQKRRVGIPRRVRALVPHSVAARRHRQEGPPLGTVWFRYSGVLFTLAVAVVIELAFGTPLQVSHPTSLLLVAVVYTIVTGRLLAGMTSASIAVAYEIYFFTTHGDALRYTVGSIIALCLIVPLTAAMVGVLRKREADAWAEREWLLREQAQTQTHTLALEHANRRMDEFLSIASHELRAPLAALRLAIQLGQRQLTRTAALPSEDRASGGIESPGPAVLDLLARADGQVDRLDRLVRDLLDVSRLQSGSLSITRAPCDLVALVREVTDAYTLMVPEREFTVELAEAPVMTEADADRIRQVLENFLNNALRYDQTGRLIAVTLSANAREARVTVRDQGPGIAPGQQRAIWERFQRAGHASGSGAGETTGGGGMGLGLYISRELIDRHGGRIGVESQPGAGAAFWFSLLREPTRPAHDEAARVEGVEAERVAEAHPVAHA
jgi:signal transduction histidine kinase